MSHKHRLKTVNLLINMLAMLFLTICWNLFADCKFVPKYANDKTDPKVQDFYENGTYGYSVSLPEGIVGHTAPAAAPQHGFRVLLSDSSQSYIW